MAKTGRNSPCPCGSGKKFKKCCLKRPAPAPAATPMRLQDAYSELIRAGQNAFGELSSPILELACGKLSREPEWLLETEAAIERLATACILGFDTGDDLLRPLHRKIEQALHGSPAAPLLHALGSATFGVWRPYEGRRDTKLRVSPVYDCGLHPGGVLDGLFGVFVGQQPMLDVPCVGWSFKYHGLSMLLVLEQLDEEGMDYLENDEEEWPEHTADARVLAALLDPECLCALWGEEEEDDDNDEEQFRWLFENISSMYLRPVRSRELVEETLSVLEGAAPPEWSRASGQLRWPREALAAATDADGERAVSESIDAVLRETHHRRVAPWMPAQTPTLGERLAKSEAPAALRERLALSPEGELTGVDEAALRAKPAALLLLPDDHPMWGTVTPTLPIKMALRWAGHEATEVEAAYATLRKEVRWAATFATEIDERNRLGRRSVFSSTLHALQTFFDPRVAETPIEDLGMTSGATTRLQSALRQMMGSMPDEGGFQVRHIPIDCNLLLRQRGFGPGSLDRLFDAVRSLAAHWRERRAGIRRSATPTPIAPVASLQEGLGELAALFGS